MIGLAALCPGGTWAAPRSIVGEWAASPGDCGTQFAYRVDAGSIVSDTLSCDLPKVSRKGAVVRFEGTCDTGQGPVAQVVVAEERDGGLDIRFGKDGGSLDRMARCPAGQPRG